MLGSVGGPEPEPASRLHAIPERRRCSTTLPQRRAGRLRRAAIHTATLRGAAADRAEERPVLPASQLRKHAALEQVLSAYTNDIAKRVPIHPEYAAGILDEVASEDAVFTVDTDVLRVGGALHHPERPARVISSFLHGSMANALPHAIGAQHAYPGRRVIPADALGEIDARLRRRTSAERVAEGVGCAAASGATGTPSRFINGRCHRAAVTSQR